MGREVRRVPANWQHPKNDKGRYVPLFDGAKFEERLASYDKEAQKWADGFRLDYYTGSWIPLGEEQKCLTYSSLVGERPDPKDYMPIWNDEERTHFMMYEDTSEGTPISPAFATTEELAWWLTENNASWFADKGASFESWMTIIDDSANSIPVSIRWRG